MSDGPGVPAVPEAAPPPLPVPAETRSSKLLTTLGMGGALAGLLLVVVYGLTLPTIEANKARELAAAVNEVLATPERYETLYVVGGALTREPPPGVNPRSLEQVYLGYAPGNRRVGFAIVAGEPGFQDVIRLIFGYDPATRRVLGMKVLESKETPGLGDRIEKDEAFVSQFVGAETPFVGVKGKRSAPNEIHMITGATISSRAVIRIINNALERMRPLLEAYPQEGKG